MEACIHSVCISDGSLHSWISSGLEMCVFYSLALNVGEAPKYQGRMKQSKPHSQLILLILLVTEATTFYASEPKYVDFVEMVEEADFIVIGTLSEVGAPDTMLQTIDVEEYLKNPRNDSQITLRVTDEDTAGGEFSDLYTGPFLSTGKMLVFVVMRGGFNRLLNGTYGVYQVTKKTSSDPDTWRLRKTWLTSRHESAALYVHHYYDVVKSDNATDPTVNFLVNETKSEVLHIIPEVNIVGSLLFVLIAVLAVIGSVNRLRRMG